MPPLNLLIKPASGNCNMRCKYCFYADVAENREVFSYGMMAEETLETIVKRSLQYAHRECTFAFQGGEPTLRGLDFYRKLIEYVNIYNKNSLTIHYAIQTNGMVIDDEWAEFLAKNKFLTGISLDGIQETHDYNRLSSNGSDTYKTVLHAIQLLKKHNAEFNILTVVNAQTAKRIGKIYGFYKRNNFNYQQYIPCLDPIGEERGLHSYSLTPDQYEQFLKTRFDLWYNDVIRGEFTYDRYFENLTGMLLGYAPESCGMIGHCTNQVVIESDGSVYPCDFYVMDQYKIGNLLTDDFDTINRNRENLGFIQESMKTEEDCRLCKWLQLCRGGCRRDRDPMIDGKLVKNYFCKAYKGFFEYSYKRLQELAERALKKHTL